MKGSVGKDDYKFDKSSPGSHAVFLGNIQEDQCNGNPVMNVRNKVFAGERVEVLKPDGTIGDHTMPKILKDIEGEQMVNASHPKLLELPFDLPPLTIVRRVLKPASR